MKSGILFYSWLSGAATVGFIASFNEAYGRTFGHHSDAIFMFSVEAVIFGGIAVVLTLASDK